MRSILSLTFLLLLPLMLFSQLDQDSLTWLSIEKFFPVTAYDSTSAVTARTARIIHFYNPDEEPYFPSEKGELEESVVPIILQEAWDREINALTIKGEAISNSILNWAKWDTLEKISDSLTLRKYSILGTRDVNKMPLLLVEDWSLNSTGISSEVVAYAVLADDDQELFFWVFQNDESITPKYFQKPDSLTDISKSKEPFPNIPPPEANWMRRTTRTINVFPEEHSEQLFQHFQFIQKSEEVRIIDQDNKQVDLYKQRTDTFWVEPKQGEDSPSFLTTYNYEQPIVGFEIVQDWWWNKQMNRLENKIVAFAPYYEVFDQTTGDYMGNGYYYWIIMESP